MALPVYPPLSRVPRLCFWELTHACNLRCIHCEADAGRAAPDRRTAVRLLLILVMRLGNSQPQGEAG